MIEIKKVYTKGNLIFGNNLKMLRINKGMTQVDIAKKLGVQHKTYVDWEKAHKIPQARHWKKIGEFFGLENPLTLLYEDMWNNLSTEELIKIGKSPYRKRKA